MSESPSPGAASNGSVATTQTITRDGRPPSGIPVPINKRNSFSLSSSLAQSTGSTTSSQNGIRSASPVLLSQAASGRRTPSYGRRQSLLGTSMSRKTSFSETSGDDTAQLKVQIALLQSSLHGAHQRILDLTADMNLDSSTASSYDPRAGPSSRPITPSAAYPDLSIPGVGTTDVNETVQEDVDGEMEDGKLDMRQDLPSKIPRLPHSSSNYDLVSSAATPGKGVPQGARKTSDGPLGISRIPQASVAHAVVLHSNTPTSSPSAAAKLFSRTLSSTSSPDASLQSPFPGPNTPLSPGGQSDGLLSPAPRKFSGGSAASTRVIDALQTELGNVKGHNDKLKLEVRSNQRLIGSLTRQCEDLKETKERMKMEVDGLNNIVNRKERMLQDVLERARTAESSLAQHVSTKKALEQSTKKSLQQMSTQLTEAQTAQSKAERECSSLRDSVKSLKDVWGREMKGIKEEIKRSEDKARKDLDDARDNHIQLVKLVQAQTAERTSIQDLAQESLATSVKANAIFDQQIEDLRTQLQRSEAESASARGTASELAEELVRLRRLMREPRRSSLEGASQILVE